MSVEILGHKVCHAENILILLTIPYTTPISDTNPQIHTFMERL